MNREEFNVACKYASEVCGLYAEMMDRKVGAETLGTVMKLGCSVRSALMNEATLVKVDGEDFSVLTDKVEDPDFVVPDEVAIETIRRLRMTSMLHLEDMQGRIEKNTLGEAVCLMVGALEVDELEGHSNRLVLADRMMLLYDDWREAEMGFFGAMLGELLITGLNAIKVIVEELDDDDDEEGNEPLTDEEVEIVHRSYELLEQYYKRIDAFTKKYPRLWGLFCDEECEKCCFDGMHGHEDNFDD